VLGLNALPPQRLEERQREILVKKHLHDAWRTAGGRWAATWAAYRSAART
jgi:hypothetical protein